jgi:hypothetical protein
MKRREAAAVALLAFALAPLLKRNWTVSVLPQLAAVTLLYMCSPTVHTSLYILNVYVIMSSIINPA